MLDTKFLNTIDKLAKQVRFLPGFSKNISQDMKIKLLLEWFKKYNYIDKKIELTSENIELFLGKDQTFDPDFKILELAFGPATCGKNGGTTKLGKNEIYCRLYHNWYNTPFNTIKIFKITWNGRIKFVRDLRSTPELE